ncbi:hypothetical protein [Borreliella burgdorferi]|uniref:BB0158 famile outer surface lipoprotein n=1 Tax=Borreliella burgdorferi TaxID=139 RepID=UPI00017F3856|nr:hypothetical protein [Borreliella burgdorferi]ACN55618.1 hypothetical protein BBUWI9123_F0015 [Borreliella burgdorferi WI91-23]
MPITKIIAFEITRKFEEKYEVKSLKLISERSNINFEQYRAGIAQISLKDVSKESRYINSYNFRVLNDDLINSFKLLYKKNKYAYMLASLAIKNRKTNKDVTYEIALNSRLFTDTIKLIFDKYPIYQTRN